MRLGRYFRSAFKAWHGSDNVIELLASTKTADEQSRSESGDFFVLLCAAYVASNHANVLE